MTANWYKKSFRRLLVDMHIPDWNPEFFSCFSAERYAEMMKEANIDTAIIYAGSCLGLCNWPTKVGWQHRQQNGRDFLGEIVRACREKGLNIVIYLNVWSRKAYEEHPEWRIILPDGKGTLEQENSRYGLCCPNTAFKEYFLDLVDELNNNYECQGLWIDMIGWFWKICYCPACLARFQAETGYSELPRKIDWNDPEWLAFQDCREKWLTEFAAAIRQKVKSRKPERSLALQTSSLVGGWGGATSSEFVLQSDYLCGDFVGDSLEQSMVCKLLNALSENHPIEFMTPRCENLGHHTTERSFVNLQMRAYAALSNNACFTFIDAIDPRGTLNAGFYKRAGQINEEFSRYEKYLSADAAPMADVAIYYSFDSSFSKDSKIVDTKDFKFELSDYYRNQNIIKALNAAHLNFTFVSRRDLAGLQQYPLLILPDESILDPAEISAVKDYVRNGGKLYASFHTSLYDKTQGCLKDFLLAELFGAHFTGKETPAINYLAPAPGSPLSEFCSADYPLMLESKQLILEADGDAEVLATLTLPYADPADCVFFGSAISNPPGISTTHPAMLRKRYGRGESIYVAGDLEGLPYDQHRRIFTALLLELLGGKSMIKTNAPATTEITVFKHPVSKQLVISLLNLPAELPPIPLFELKFELDIPEIVPIALFSAPDETPLKFSRNASNGKIEFVLDKLEKFRMLILKYE
jgi:hypothetical protein